MEWKQVRSYRWITDEGYEILEEAPFLKTIEDQLVAVPVWSWRGPGMSARDFCECESFEIAKLRAEGHYALSV